MLQYTKVTTHFLILFFLLDGLDSDDDASLLYYSTQDSILNSLNIVHSIVAYKFVSNGVEYDSLVHRLYSMPNPVQVIYCSCNKVDHDYGENQVRNDLINIGSNLFRLKFFFNK